MRDYRLPKVLRFSPSQEPAAHPTLQDNSDPSSCQWAQRPTKDGLFFFSPGSPTKNVKTARNPAIAELEEPLDHILADAQHRADVDQSAEEADHSGPASVHIQQSSLASPCKSLEQAGARAALGPN